MVKQASKVVDDEDDKEDQKIQMDNIIDAKSRVYVRKKEYA